MTTPDRSEASTPGGSIDSDAELQARERLEDQLILDLERDQFVTETSRPVPRAHLSRSAVAWLWILRVFCVLVSLMVIYAFVASLN